MPIYLNVSHSAFSSIVMGDRLILIYKFCHRTIQMFIVRVYIFFYILFKRPIVNVWHITTPQDDKNAYEDILEQSFITKLGNFEIMVYLTNNFKIIDIVSSIFKVIICRRY